jgi:hypothetical protein
LKKAAPFHSGKNSVADAVIFELYQTAVQVADLTKYPHAFITSNHTDFSRANGDKREPHDDLADAFDGIGSRYALGVDGLNIVLCDHFGEEIEELFEETDFQEEPRRLDEPNGTGTQRSLSATKTSTAPHVRASRLPIPSPGSSGLTRTLSSGC